MALLNVSLQDGHSSSSPAALKSKSSVGNFSVNILN